MEEIYKNIKDQLWVESDGQEYILHWMSWGFQSGEQSKEIEKSDYEAYRQGEHTADELLYKATYGVWPLPQEAQDRIRKQRIEERPSIFINSLNNNDKSVLGLFTKSELKDFVPKAEAIYQSLNGDLPARYLELKETF